MRDFARTIRLPLIALSWAVASLVGAYSARAWLRSGLTFDHLVSGWWLLIALTFVLGGQLSAFIWLADAKTWAQEKVTWRVILRDVGGFLATNAAALSAVLAIVRSQGWR